MVGFVPVHMFICEHIASHKRDQHDYLQQLSANKQSASVTRHDHFGLIHRCLELLVHYLEKVFSVFFKANYTESYSLHASKSHIHTKWHICKYSLLPFHCKIYVTWTAQCKCKYMCVSTIL